MNIFFIAIENITILNCNVYILFSYVDTVKTRASGTNVKI